MSFEITPDVVLQAYRLGFFPMAESRDDPTIYWVDPEQRGILPFANFRIPHSLRKTIKRQPYAIRCNTDFRSVIRACGARTAKRQESWINNTIADLYTDLHEVGYAHSIEAWEGDNLVGGLYGVTMGSAFFGESMFARRPDASKLCLVDLVARLQYSEFTLLDTQFVNDHLARFGAMEIPRAQYRLLLEEALQQRATFYSEPLPSSVLTSFIQSNSQTS
jgi:leucyl/phenylalanyl-tRNA--protein transferase